MNAQYKILKCDEFVEKLKSFRINFERHSIYHIQIQSQHNFYPSKGTYYNSESGAKFKYPNFKDSNDFLAFLSENVT